MKREKDRNPQDFTITVFGAGISGLTAAHELVERGFKVQVIDPDINGEVHPATLDRGIGGMARSQFACTLAGTGSDEEVTNLEPASKFLVDDVLVFEPDAAISSQRSREIVVRLLALLRDQRVRSVWVLLPRFDGAEPSAEQRYNSLIAKLKDNSATDAEVSKLKRSDFVAPESYPKQGARWARFTVNLNRYPAEHGFRFFPAFYRHLFDTMRRTRILNRLPFETGSTVYDNLVPSEGLGLARAGRARAFVVPRRKMRSFEELRTLLGLVLTELNYDVSDIELFALKIFKYMTSSTIRRKTEYEHLSWAQFMEIERYSPVVREHMEFSSQMTAALRGSKTDARTQGNITVQLLMDQLKTTDETDSKLNGPTSSAWFDHWHDYLSTQGVTFERGKLTGFKHEDGSVSPVVEGAEALGSHYIIALSLPAVAELAPRFLAAAAAGGIAIPKDNDFARISSFIARRPGADSHTNLELFNQDLKCSAPEGPLQHLSGIQYYFDSDIHFWAGHTEYLDSQWGLTSIAQPQFWARARDTSTAYRGILSVDIGIWNRAFVDKALGAGPGMEAWSCDAAAIAELTWSQIKDHHDDAIRFKYGPNAKISSPIAFALDQNLTFGAGGVIDDKTPFLVNRTSAYPTRPGRVVDSSAQGPNEWPKSKVKSEYSVILKRARNPNKYGDTGSGYVIAGTFMQTFTRLTSMEGANESARHAVNALLNVLGTNADRCEIWDPEENEMLDLQWFKDLDQRLFLEGRAHLVDILEWQRLPETLCPRSVLSLKSLAAGIL